MAYPAYQLIDKGPAQRVDLTDTDLPEGDVTVDVAYSSLNFKDGLAITGKGRIARSLPMVCGIDLAGTVTESASSDWKPGDQVVLTGWGLSETHPGGYTTRQRVRSEWLVAKPAGLALAQTMAIGTAGFTAMLSFLALEDAGVRPWSGPVLVTGAGGGVGSVAVAVLAKLGYEVHASTGRAETHDYLRSLGASAIVDRSEFTEPGKPLGTERWAGAVDTVGSTTLANVLSQTQRAGAVASCGLAGGPDLPATVMPFILRGVSLLGIDSVMCPMPRREEAWRRLAADLPLPMLDSMTETHGFDEIPELADRILAGRTRGRVVIAVQ
ncbi:MDR family oxidoreductase [Ammonicoccus fulvus]|uniref:MDR family oxidoreductase n=1 Tax=Ammonicoccus fulvus TaxID=3138240 RepID=A0ABZ3FKW9_9ACTN